MYLTELSNKQKQLFLDVCISLSKADNDFADEEKKVINSLCDEMSIEPRYDTMANSVDCLNEMNSISTSREKRIVVIELLGIVMADNRIAPEEEKYMMKVLDIFGIEHDELKTAVELVNELYGVYSKFANFIGK